MSETRSNLNKANTQLIESEIRVREILEQAPLGMCMVSGPEHIIEIANESILKIWGRNKKDVIGKAHRSGSTFYFSLSLLISNSLIGRCY